MAVLNSNWNNIPIKLTYETASWKQRNYQNFTIDFTQGNPIYAIIKKYAIVDNAYKIKHVLE